MGAVSMTDPQAAPTCYAHPGRVAGSICRRCGRPICPDCMREAPVGWQCVSCVKSDSRTAPVIHWRPNRPGGGVGRLGNTRLTPVVLVLIGINVAAYLYERSHLTYSFATHYFLYPGLVHTHWYMLITSAFLHASVTHILLNMVSLAIVGPAVEAEVGRLRFVALYLLAAVGGSVGYYLLAPQYQPGVGASGAIFGLLGAYFVVAKLRGWPVQQIVALLAINVIFSFSGGIAWQAHLGGLVTGTLVCFGLMWSPRRSGRVSEVAQVVQGLAVLVAGAIVLGLLVQIPPGHVNV